MNEKEYSIVLRDGEELRDYGDGTLRRANGTIAYLPSEVSRDRILQRWNNGQAAAMNAMMKELNAETPEEAAELLLRKTVRVAMEDNTRVGNDAARLILRQSGFLQTNVKTVQGQVTHRNELVIDDQTRTMIERLARMKRSEDDYIDVAEDDDEEDS